MARALLQALADGNLPQGLLAGDRQYLLLLNASGTILAVPLWTRSDAATWAPLTFDLTSYRGQAIQVRFGVYNDGNGQSTALYLDDTTLAPPSKPGRPGPARCVQGLDAAGMVGAPMTHICQVSPSVL